MRGLNSVARRDVVRVLIDSAKIDIVCLQEMKMASFSRPCLEVISTTISFVFLRSDLVEGS
jgi:exonuclease III